ncbi:MAG TPA: phytanoyl-CoA dioxygenase family protein, partial [Acidimicrobiales bacterium]|nr:phytanoyl-CoA dioxygenase family protein [Acidimicrobiales bacterium]
MSTESVTLPDLSSPYDVPAAKITEFRVNGHVMLPAVASPEEIAAWGPFIEDLAYAHADERPLDYAGMVTQVQNLWCQDDRMRAYSLGERFGRIAADLLGVDAVRIYHDQAVFKEAAGAPTPFHQDGYYFPLDGHQALTMWMPLVPVTDEMGGSMTFASGSQRLGYLGNYEISDETEAVLLEVAEREGLPMETHGAMSPGDTTWHNGWTLHRAPANDTDQLRAVMTVIFYADGLVGTEPQHEWHSKDYAKWLPG